MQLRTGQCKAKSRTAIRIVRGPEATVVRFYDGATDIKPHSETFGFGAEKWFEQALGIREPMAAIHDAHFNLVIVHVDSDKQIADFGLFH